MQTLVIVGASLAGITAARASRMSGFDGKIVMIGDEPDRPYDRPPLSKDFLLGALSQEEISLEHPDEDLDIQWHLGQRATALQAFPLAVMLQDGTTIAADTLIIASGARARQIPSLAAFKNVYTLRGIKDAQRLHQDLPQISHLSILGAGFIGTEIASVARSLGIDVALIDTSSRPFARFLGEDVARAICHLQVAHGVDLRCGRSIINTHGQEDFLTHLELSDGQTLATDAVLVGIGATPNTEWVTGSDLHLTSTGNIMCNEVGLTNIPGVYAVGDCAAWLDPRIGAPAPSEHWTNAKEQATVAVAHMLGSTRIPVRRPPYFWSDQHNTNLQFAGHLHGDEQVSFESGSPHSHDLLAVYSQGSKPVAVFGMNQPRLFNTWRKSLTKLAVA